MPCCDRLAARLTAVVVLPTPPFWLAIVMIRHRSGGATPPVPAPRTPTAASAARPIGVSASVVIGASGTTTCDSGTEVAGCGTSALLHCWGRWHGAAVITAPGFHVKPPPPARSEPGPTREGADPRDRSPTYPPRPVRSRPAQRIGKTEDQPLTAASRARARLAARTVPPSGHPTPTALSTCSLLSAVSSHNDTDNRCRRYNPTVTGLQNLRTPHAKSGQNRLRRLQFLRRGLPLDREQLATGSQQGGGPADEPVERRDRPGRRHVRADTRRRLILGPGAEHGRVGQIERASRTPRERPSDAAAARAAPPEPRAEASRARSPAAPPRSRCRRALPAPAPARPPGRSSAGGDPTAVRFPGGR